jgi:hypothetical protein
MVLRPSLDLARTDGGLVDTDQRLVRETRSRIEDFGERSPVIDVCHGAANQHAVDQGLYRFALWRDCSDIAFAL